MSLARQMVENQLFLSVSEARRKIAEHAVKVNGAVVISDELQLRDGDIVQIGNRIPKKICVGMQEAKAGRL